MKRKQPHSNRQNPCERRVKLMGLSNECKALGPDSLTLDPCLLSGGTAVYHPGFLGRLRTFQSQAWKEGGNNVYTKLQAKITMPQKRKP